MSALDHRVALEFDGNGISAKLICPEHGCEPAQVCGKCGRAYGDSEIEACYDCKDVAPEECWIKTWFDNESPDELLHGKLGEFLIDAKWMGDHLEAHVVAFIEPLPAGGES